MSDETFASLPRDSGFDQTRQLLREGYRFLPERFRRLHTDLFQTRLMLKRAVCVQGEAAARMFYEKDRFTRRGALPPTAILSLQGYGSVQTLDGERHRWRKQLFLSLLSPPRAHQLGERFEARWRAELPLWRGRDVVLLHAVRRLLTETVCDWAGIELDPRTLARRAREFGAMINGAGAAGPRNWYGLWLRRRTQRWARTLIDRERAGSSAPAGSALAAIAAWRDIDGKMLERRIAATELLNVLRPTVATDRYITFAALALHEHPHWRARLQAGGPAELHAFAQEVRRFYPFFPAIGGRVRRSFVWHGIRFRRGTWVLLDVHGTHHDARSWADPDAFRPERFLARPSNGFDLLAQGGGDAATGHRCPGEAVTLELMMRALRLLTSGAIDYEIPVQDLTIDPGRMPAVPRSRLVLRVR